MVIYLACQPAYTHSYLPFALIAYLSLPGVGVGSMVFLCERDMEDGGDGDGGWGQAGVFVHL